MVGANSGSAFATHSAEHCQIMSEEQQPPRGRNLPTHGMGPDSEQARSVHRVLVNRERKQKAIDACDDCQLKYIKCLNNMDYISYFRAMQSGGMCNDEFKAFSDCYHAARGPLQNPANDAAFSMDTPVPEYAFWSRWVRSLGIHRDMFGGVLKPIVVWETENTAEAPPPPPPPPPAPTTAPTKVWWRFW